MYLLLKIWVIFIDFPACHVHLLEAFSPIFTPQKAEKVHRLEAH